MTRREWLFQAVAAARPVRTHWKTLTGGPAHHFFGYYGMSPWNRSGNRLVCLESDFQDHLPGPSEAARIGLVDQVSGAFTPLAETRAWNLQQGAMMHWNPLAPETGILFNDRHEGGVAAVSLDVTTRKKRRYGRAISAVSRNSRYALSLTYGRLTRMRPVVGYPGTQDPNPGDPHPEGDGVFLLDLESGDTRLVVSIGEVYRRLVKRHPELRERHMWFNHTVFSRDDARFLFLARCWNPSPRRRLESAVFTCARDGSDLREVVPFGIGVSHMDWRNGRQIIVTFPYRSGQLQHVLFTDGKADYRVVGEGFLAGDGHVTFSPGGDWLATDRNDLEAVAKHLLLYNVATGQGVAVGTFPMLKKEFLGGDVRCDLHPRWRGDGRAIAFDAIHPATGTRQLHVAEVEL